MERFVFFSNFSVCLFFFGETKEQTQEEKMALTVDCREASFWEPTFNELKEMVEEVPSFGSSTPLQQCVYIMWGVAFLCWLVSVLMHNYSQVFFFSISFFFLIIIPFFFSSPSFLSSFPSPLPARLIDCGLSSPPFMLLFSVLPMVEIARG